MGMSRVRACNQWLRMGTGDEYRCSVPTRDKSGKCYKHRPRPYRAPFIPADKLAKQKALSNA